jgi:3-methyladenine DNA glycosylase AlkD
VTEIPLYQEVVSALESAKTDAKYEKFVEEMHKTPGVLWYGIRTPDVDRLIKDFQPRFERLSPRQRLRLANRFYRSGYVEQSSFGLALLRMTLDAITPETFDYLDDLIIHCNNWGACDSFALYVIQPLLDRYYHETVALLRAWNGSGNLWKKRASVVAFTRDVGTTGRYTNLVLELCENLINDPEDLVQKGVGWALKDNLRGNRQVVLNYIKDLRRRHVPATITLYAIKDLTGTARESVLKIK